MRTRPGLPGGVLVSAPDDVDPRGARRVDPHPTAPDAGSFFGMGVADIAIRN